MPLEDKIFSGRNESRIFGIDLDLDFPNMGVHAGIYQRNEIKRIRMENKDNDLE